MRYFVWGMLLWASVGICQESVECVESPSSESTDCSDSAQPSVEGKNEGFYAEVFLGALIGNQRRLDPNEPVQPFDPAPKPNSLWGIRMGFPLFLPSLRGEVSVINPVAGTKFPSNMIQPERSAYSLRITCINLPLGMRCHYFHVSDHQVSAIVSSNNGGFDKSFANGFLDTLFLEKQFPLDDESHVDAGLGYWKSTEGANLSQYFDVPGYYLTRYSSQGLSANVSASLQMQSGVSAKIALLGVKNFHPTVLIPETYAAYKDQPLAVYKDFLAICVSASVNCTLGSSPVKISLTTLGGIKNVENGNDRRVPSDPPIRIDPELYAMSMTLSIRFDGKK